MHLERRDDLLRLHHRGLPDALERLRLHAAVFEDSGKLALQFAAYELEHGHAAEQIKRGIALCFGAIQDGEMNRDQQCLQVGGTWLAQPRRALRGTYEFALVGRRNLHLKQRLHPAEPADITSDMET